MAPSLVTPLTLALTLVTLAEALTPLQIPSRPVGLSVGAEGPSPCTVDVFVDPLSSPARHTFQQLRPLLAREDLSSRLQFRLLLFPLPQHRASFLAATAVRAVEGLANTTVALQFLGHVFDQLENFRTDVLMARNDNDVTRSLAALALPLGLGQNAVLDRMDGVARLDVKSQWQTGCARGVARVPAVFINDVPAPQAADWDMDTWATQLASLCH